MRRVRRGITVNTVLSCIAVDTPLPSLGWSPRIIRHADAKYGAFRLTGRRCRAAALAAAIPAHTGLGWLLPRHPAGCANSIATLIKAVLTRARFGLEMRGCRGVLTPAGPFACWLDHRPVRLRVRPLSCARWHIFRGSRTTTRIGWRRLQPIYDNGRGAAAGLANCRRAGRTFLWPDAIPGNSSIYD
jgi:hypothetical protein